MTTTDSGISGVFWQDFGEEAIYFDMPPLADCDLVACIDREPSLEGYLWFIMNRRAGPEWNEAEGVAPTLPEAQEACLSALMKLLSPDHLLKVTRFLMPKIDPALVAPLRAGEDQLWKLSDTGYHLCFEPGFLLSFAALVSRDESDGLFDWTVVDFSDELAGGQAKSVEDAKNLALSALLDELPENEGRQLLLVLTAAPAGAEPAPAEAAR